MVEIDRAVVNWSDAGSLAGRPLVILLHGYTRDEHTLDEVTAALGPDFVTAALRGPRPARSENGGNGWWDVDEFHIPEPGQDVETVAAVLGWLDETIAERGAPSAIAIVGHSQGGALSTTLVRNAPERFTAAVVVAGAWMPQVQPADTRLAAEHPALFWARTENDPAISGQSVHGLRAALASIGAADAEHVYPGAEHAVIPEQLTDLVAFLREQVLG